jgi:acyl carrier protein
MRITGIDALDLAFRLEKRFGIKISQAEGMAVLFDTPGTIHRFLIANEANIDRPLASTA